MLKADHQQAERTFWSPARKAWAVLLTAFAIFCLLSATTVVAVGRWLRMAELPHLTTALAQPVTVLIQRAGMVMPVEMQPSDELRAGDQLIVNNAGPGVAATTQLVPGELAVWAKTSIEVLSFVPNETLRLGLVRGQALITLPSGGRAVEITAPKVSVALTAPGLYRVRRLSAESLTTAASEYSSAPALEIAVEQGEALIGADHIGPGERRLVAAQTAALPNEWPLIRDSDFRAFSDTEYNNTQIVAELPGQRKADTWGVSLAPSAGPKWRTGQFHLEQDCQPATAAAVEPPCRSVARFVRLGGNEQSSITAISQAVSADVVSYRQVLLNADVRIKSQSLSKGGVLGTECPVMIRVWYANTESTNLEVDFCFWAVDDPNQKGVISNNPWIKSTQINLQSWQHFSVDLKREIPNLMTIDKVQVDANGHDYETNVADVRLDGVGLADAPPRASSEAGAAGRPGSR